MFSAAQNTQRWFAVGNTDFLHAQFLQIPVRHHHKPLKRLRSRKLRRHFIRKSVQKTPQPTTLKTPVNCPHCGQKWLGRASVKTPALYPAQNRTGYMMRKSEAKSCKNGKRKSSVRAFFCREKNALLYRFRTIDHKRLTFAFTPESGYLLALASKIAHSGSQGQTGGIFVRGCL